MPITGLYPKDKKKTVVKELDYIIIKETVNISKTYISRIPGKVRTFTKMLNIALHRRIL